MLYKLLSIANNTFTETLRQPVYAVIIVLALFMMFMSPAIAMYTLDEDIKLLRELALSTLFLAGLFIAIFSATSAVTEEIETKTITTVLSKPVSRPTFIVGKFLGIIAAVALGHYILTLATLLAVRHGVLSTATDTHDWTVITAAALTVLATLLISAFLNFTYDWNFSASAIGLTALFESISIAVLTFMDRNWAYNPAGNGFSTFDIYASVLLLMAVVVLVALAVMFSTRLNVVLTLTCCVGVFLLGLISDYVFGQFAAGHLWARLGRMLLPNLQVFWASDAIYGSGTIPAAYLLTIALYSVLYSTGILFLAVSLFQRRQIG